MDPAVARILDANFNRAREALRVMEDYARFALDDARLSEALKDLRHALAAAVETAHLSSAIILRDTPGDVGTELTAGGEYERASAGDVVRAAGKRLSEAFRAIEEYGKTVEPRLAADVERLRYRGYDLEKRLVHTVDARARFGNVRLYVLITESLCRGPWRETASAVIDGGADCLQLREKGLSDGELFDRAVALGELCHRAGALCIINDRADVAAATGADGVHVGQDDLSVSAARRIVGPDKIVGVSTHSVEQARAVVDSCPDYVAVGPMYDTPTKPQEHLAGPETLAGVRQITALPLVAIGGISADNLDPILATGCRCVCVCSSAITQEDPTAAARRIRQQLDPGVA